MSPTVHWVVDGHVALITIDRPEVRNAINRETALAIAEAIDAAEVDDAVRSMVLTGAGDTFCAGMDLKAFSKTGERPVTPSRGGFGIVQRPPEKPIVAAVSGKALGGGFEIALACDLIVADSDAAFGLPEVTRGLVATGGGVLRLPRRVPHTLAMEMILTGEPISARRAAECGLVNVVAERGQAVSAAMKLAHQIALNAPLALRAAKKVANSTHTWAEEEGFRLQDPIVDAVRRSQDAAEGARAFVEKRAPQWTGA